MDDGGSDNDEVEEKDENEVFMLEEGVEKATEEEESEGQHGHRQHHQPLRLEHMTFDEERGEGPEEGDEAQKGES